MNKLTKSLAAAAIVASAVLAGPVAANAAAAYPPGTPTVVGAAAGTVVGSTAPGGTFTVRFHAVFRPQHDLTIYFTSAGSVPTSLADFRAAESPALTTRSDAAGAASVTATMPSDASAAVTVTATDGATTAAITVPVSTASGAVATSAGGSSPLAQTGTDLSLAELWGAAGVVVLGGAFVAVSVRRKRSE